MSHYQAARASFDEYAGIPASQLPPGRIRALQVRLTRWELRQFGYQPPMTAALGVAEEVGELADARSYDDAVDALGDATVYACQLATHYRLDLQSLLYVASHENLKAASVVGALCHVVLKESQGIRGYSDPDVAREAVYRCLVKLLCYLRHAGGVAVVLEDVFEGVAERVLQRDWRLNPTNGASHA